MTIALTQMPKKTAKTLPGDPDASEQLAFRAPVNLVKRLDQTGKKLGLDRSNFLRQMLAECLHIYEKRVKEIEESERGRN